MGPPNARKGKGGEGGLCVALGQTGSRSVEEGEGKGGGKGKGDGEGV